MLLTLEKNTVTQTGILRTAKATIKASPRLFGFFETGVYGSNLKAVVLRELVANAMDAHVMADKANTPAYVQLPTDDDPRVIVRDEGIGMSPEFMLDNFMRYTDASTKNDTNKQIGGFGIGSKSPLAIVDQVTFTVVYDGIRSVYTMFKDEDGIPSIALLHQAPTNDTNGVEVSFAPEDTNGWLEAANQALAYFEPLPTGIDITPPTYIAKGNRWGVRPESGPPGVIMGGIRYPVDVQAFHYDQRWDDFWKYGVDIRLPIGAVTPSLSRDALSYDDATKAAIIAAMNNIKAEVIESFSTIFDVYETEYEAKVALAREISSSYGRGSFLRTNAKYKGEPLDLFVQSTGEVYAWEIGTRKMSIGSSAFSTRRVSFDPSKTDLILDDAPTAPVKRLHHRFYRNRTNKVLIVKQDDFHKLGDIPAAYYTRLSDLPEPPREAREKRVHCKWFITSRNWSGDNLLRSWMRAPREGEAPDSGVLVVMDKFAIPSSVQRNWQAGLIAVSELVFVNKIDARKVKHLPLFGDVFKERLDAALANAQGLAEYLALVRAHELAPYFRFIRDHRRHLTLTPAQRARPFGKIVALYDQYMARQPSTNLASFVEPRMPPRVNPQRLAEGVSEKVKTYLGLNPTTPAQVKLLLEFV